MNATVNTKPTTQTIDELLSQLEKLMKAEYENASIHSELVTAYNHMVAAQDKIWKQGRN